MYFQKHINNKRGVIMAITKDMTIGEVIKADPKNGDTLMSMGMGCVYCPSALGETLEQAAMVHGIDVDELVNELNK